MSTSESPLIKKEGKYIIKFVGLLQIKDKNENLCTFFSFPKEYEYSNDEIEVKKQMKQVLKSIFKSSVSNNGILEMQENGYYINRIEIINQLLKYYNENGLYKKNEKINKTSFSGNINWGKTINKLTPNSKHRFDKYIITKKTTYANIITDSMAYIIENGTKEYDFYFENEINTKHIYNIKIFDNLYKVIELLKKELTITFKDTDKHLITNLINYFENSTTIVSTGTTIATTSFNLVFEKMVSYMLGKEYESQQKYEVGLKGKKLEDTYKIYIDHFNKEKKHIIDSKYYTYSQNTSLDYKQLFYQYHIFRKSPDIKINDWKNILIKPAECGKNNEITYHIKRTLKDHGDDIIIHEYYVNINELIDDYVENKSNGKSINSTIIDEINTKN